MKYIIITPIYNEANYIEKTILSVIQQTILPALWLIVDDSSNDNSVSIVKSYSKKYSWIKIIQKEKSHLPFGENVVAGFSFGYNRIKENDYDFIVKLDGDIDLIRKDYFEFQIKKFQKNQRLGITSGITFYFSNGNKIIVNHPVWRTTGAMKMYRTECFEDIGGLAPIFGWDGLDEYKAMYNGWITRTFNELEVLHLKKQVSLKRESKPMYFEKKGLSFYRRGYPIEFILLKILKLLLSFSLINGIYLAKGYLTALIKNENQYVNKEEKKFVRKFQYKRFFYTNSLDNLK